MLMQQAPAAVEKRVGSLYRLYTCPYLAMILGMNGCAMYWTCSRKMTVFLQQLRVRGWASCCSIIWSHLDNFLRQSRSTLQQPVYRYGCWFFIQGLLIEINLREHPLKLIWGCAIAVTIVVMTLWRVSFPRHSRSIILAWSLHCTHRHCFKIISCYNPPPTVTSST